MSDNKSNDAALQTIDALVAINPRLALRNILSVVVGVTGARGGVVLERRGDELEVANGENPTEAMIASAREAWGRDRKRLEHGRQARPDGHVVAILRDPGNDHIAGVVALEAPRANAVALLEHYTGFLAACLRAPIRNDYELKRLLEENEWNVSRVARVLNVTRRTVYMRMIRLGIPRLKVNRGLD